MGTTLILFVCLLVAVSCLPVPPQLIAFKSEEFTDSEGDGKVVEYFNEGLVSPSLCGNFCTLTYPVHTYPMVREYY